MSPPQRGLVPGLTVTSYACFDIAGAQRRRDLPAGRLGAGHGPDAVPAVLPLLTRFGPITFTSASSAEIQ